MTAADSCGMEAVRASFEPAPRTCPSCDEDNAPSRNFCRSCGTVVVRFCGRCRFANELSDKFCGGCGCPVGTKARARARASASASGKARVPAAVPAKVPARVPAKVPSVPSARKRPSTPPPTPANGKATKSLAAQLVSINRGGGAPVAEAPAASGSDELGQADIDALFNP